MNERTERSNFGTELRVARSLFLISDSFQLIPGLNDFGMEAIQLVTGVVYAVAAIQYFSSGTTFSYFTHLAITNLYTIDCQATVAVNVFSLEGVLVLFASFFGNLGPGLIVVFLGCLVRWAFSTNDTAISHYFLHISSFSNTATTNGTEAYGGYQFIG